MTYNTAPILIKEEAQEIAKILVKLGHMNKHPRNSNLFITLLTKPDSPCREITLNRPDDKFINQRDKFFVTTKDDKGTQKVNSEIAKVFAKYCNRTS